MEIWGAYSEMVTSATMYVFSVTYVFGDVYIETT